MGSASNPTGDQSDGLMRTPPLSSDDIDAARVLIRCGRDHENRFGQSETSFQTSEAWAVTADVHRRCRAGMTGASRPILFLDVDGTLLPSGGVGMLAVPDAPAVWTASSNPYLGRVDRRGGLVGPLQLIGAEGRQEPAVPPEGGAAEESREAVCGAEPGEGCAVVWIWSAIRAELTRQFRRDPGWWFKGSCRVEPRVGWHGVLPAWATHRRDRTPNFSL